MSPQLKSQQTELFLPSNIINPEISKEDYLSPEAEKRRLELEQKVEIAFYEAGIALKELRDRRLYRATHVTFQQYCWERFGFSRNAAYLKMQAAVIYDTIKKKRTLANCSWQLPTNERQLRPIAQAKLPEDTQVEIWLEAVESSEGKAPSGRLVKEIVLFFQEQMTTTNPFLPGDICLIQKRDNPELKNLGGCWGIIVEVDNYYAECSVKTWLGNYNIRVEHLIKLNYSEKERHLREILYQRLIQLKSCSHIEKSAMVVLSHLGKVTESNLTIKEERLLNFLEQEYQISDVFHWFTDLQPTILLENQE